MRNKAVKQRMNYNLDKLYARVEMKCRMKLMDLRGRCYEQRCKILKERQIAYGQL